MRRFTWPFGSRMASRGRSTSGSYARAQAGSSVIQSTSGRELTSGLTRGCSGPRPRLALAVRNRVELATGAAAAEPPHEVTLASDEGGGVRVARRDPRRQGAGAPARDRGRRYGKRDLAARHAQPGRHGSAHQALRRSPLNRWVVGRLESNAHQQYLRVRTRELRPLLERPRCPIR